MESINNESRVSEYLTLAQNNQVAENEKKEELSEKTVQQPAVEKKASFPPLNLRKISVKKAKKKDRELVKKHFRKKTKDTEYDKARNVFVIKKSGKEYIFEVGKGGAPALFKSKNHKEVIAFLKKM